MTMTVQHRHDEHETKFAITDVAATIERLRQHGQFVGLAYLRDIFYRDGAGRRLRYRIEESAVGQRVEVVEKRFRSNADGIKVETEETFYEGEDPDVAGTIILGQGQFKRQNAYEKVRMSFAVGAVQATLDMYPHGVWLELEGQPDDIWTTAATLGFTQAEATTANVDELYLAWQRRHHQTELWDIRFGLEKTEIEDTIEKQL